MLVQDVVNETVLYARRPAHRLGRHCRAHPRGGHGGLDAENDAGDGDDGHRNHKHIGTHGTGGTGQMPALRESKMLWNVPRRRCGGFIGLLGQQRQRVKVLRYRLQQTWTRVRLRCRVAIQQCVAWVVAERGLRVSAFSIPLGVQRLFFLCVVRVLFHQDDVQHAWNDEISEGDKQQTVVWKQHRLELENKRKLGRGCSTQHSPAEADELVQGIGLVDEGDGNHPWENHTPKERESS